MKLTKKLIAFAVCILMIVTVFPAGVFAADEASATAETTSAESLHAHLSFDDLADGDSLSASYFNDRVTGADWKDVTSYGVDKLQAITDPMDSSNIVLAPKSGNAYGSIVLDDTSGSVFNGILDLSMRVYLTEHSGQAQVAMVRVVAESGDSVNPLAINTTIENYEKGTVTDKGTIFGTLTIAGASVTNNRSDSTAVVYYNTWHELRMVYTAKTGETVLYLDGEKAHSATIAAVDSVDYIFMNRSWSGGYVTNYFDDVDFKVLENQPLAVDSYNDFESLTAGALSAAPTLNGFSASFTNPSSVSVQTEADGNKYLSTTSGTKSNWTWTDSNKILHTGNFAISYRLMPDSANSGTCSIVSLKENVSGTEMRILHMANNAVYFGPSASYYLFSLTPSAWNDITCIVKPETETYEIYCDGKLQAFSVIEQEAGEDVYVLYRRYDAETGAWTRNVNPTWSDNRTPYGYDIATNGIRSVYMFHNNTRAFGVDDFRIYGVETAPVNALASPTSELYSVDFANSSIGSFSDCCWTSASPSGLTSLQAVGAVAKKTFGSNTLQVFAPQKGVSSAELLLQGSDYNYLDSGTLWIEGTILLSSANESTDELVFAALNHAKVVSAPLVTVSGSGAISLLGNSTGKTLSADTAYDLKVSINSLNDAVELYIDDSEEPVASATLTEAKYTTTCSFTKDTYFADGINLDSLTLFATDDMDFGVSNARVYCIDTSDLEIFGVQTGTHNGTNAIRVLAGINSLDRSKVGFTFEFWDGTRAWEPKADVNSSKVYTSVVAAGETVTAEQRGYRYIIAAIIYDIDEADAEILGIRPYTIKDGVRKYGETVAYTVAVSDGNLSVEKTSVTSSVGYTLVSQYDFEDSEETFSAYSDSNYSNLTDKNNEYKFGGQLNTNSTVVSVGAKTTQARTGEKAIAVNNIKESGTSGSATFGGRIKLSNLLPDQLTGYTGKTIRISAYVKADTFRKLTDGVAGDHDGTIQIGFGIMGDKVYTMYGNSYTVNDGEWTYVQYEFEVDDILSNDTVFPNVGETEYHYPVRPYVSFGGTTGFATNVYIDDFKVEMKESFGLTMPSIFADGMVLQRNKTVPVWGWGGSAGDVFKVSIGGNTVSGTVDANGELYVELPAMAAATDQTLTLTNTSKNGVSVSFEDVNVGEVWYCSGQSNMELKMSSVFDVDEIIANADNYDVRSFKVGVTAKYQLQNDVTSGTWKQITSSNASGVTAVGYIAAYQIQKALGVPVAIIECYEGGSAAQAWLSYEKLFAADREFIYDDETILPTVRNNWGCEGRTLWQDYDYYWSRGEIYETENAEGTLVNGTYNSTGRRFAPTGLYNAMQGPLANYAIAGVMWYQGESQPNARIASQYNYILYDLIEQWREDFNDEDLPVMLVSLAPYEAGNGRNFFEIRQVQLDTAKRLNNVGVIATSYEGTYDSNDTGGSIHPGTKVPVGNRMAATILGMVYDVAYYDGSTEYSSPLYESMTISGNKAILTFSHTADGLKIKDGDSALTGFKISADGTTFVDATATLVGNTVEVTADSVASPVAVQYCYVNVYAVTGAPDTLGGNLENSLNQPAFPFIATLSDAEIHSATIANGKLRVEIWERGYNETSHKVTVTVNGSTTSYSTSFETAGNYVIDTNISVSAGDSVTVTLSSADGNTLIETQTITLK